MVKFLFCVSFLCVTSVSAHEKVYEWTELQNLGCQVNLRRARARLTKCWRNEVMTGMVHVGGNQYQLNCSLIEVTCPVNVSFIEEKKAEKE